MKCEVIGWEKACASGFWTKNDWTVFPTVSFDDSPLIQICIV